MGYLHIDNLYKNQDVLLFKEVYAMEKIHGTSAHVALRDGQLVFHHGGENREKFLACFPDHEALKTGLQALAEMGNVEVVVFGEAYGGKQQGMSKRYGKETRFVAFDVRIGGRWLPVPHAEAICRGLGLDFVHWVRVQTDLAVLDHWRDAPSHQAVKNGVDGDQPREGIVIRPLEEMVDRYGNRVIAKHKRHEERETKTPREVSAEKAQVLADAEAIAEEWVTPMRLQHILQKFPEGTGLEATRSVLDAMVEDVLREGSGEVVDSRGVRHAICAKTAKLFRNYVAERLVTMAGPAA